MIKGKAQVIEMSLVALLARGHLLLEDVPGVGKTTLAHSLARSLDCSFKRIQFTSDLLPSDIVGVSIFNRQKQAFEFMPGPIFANIVLADEINRTTPKTQSSLLEAMSEAQISFDNKTYPLNQPFMVIATQNPAEYHGTFPLPESQLDRFLMRLRIGYPSLEEEKRSSTDRNRFIRPKSSNRCSRLMMSFYSRTRSIRFSWRKALRTIFWPLSKAPGSRICWHWV